MFANATVGTPANIASLEQSDAVRYLTEILDFLLQPHSILPLIIFFLLLWRIKSTKNTTDGLESANEKSGGALSALESSPKDAIILFGSQTGTAETYAKRLGRILSQNFAFDTSVTSLEDFPFDQFPQVPAARSPSGHEVLVIFVLATYGDGEPPDSAVDFYNELQKHAESSGVALGGLSYTIFGLGNSSYEKFNHQAVEFDTFLSKAGAARLFDVGAGDDNHGTADEDFEGWKEGFIGAVSKLPHVQVQTSDLPPPSSWRVEEMTTAEDAVYLGERNPEQLTNNGLTVGPFTAQNPYYAPVGNVKQLFSPTCGRHCLHMEFDIGETNLSYETGDHLAIWPVNPEAEIERLIRILGLQSKRSTALRIESIEDSSNACHIPSPTTYETAARYYLDICGPVSRAALGAISYFAPTAEAKDYLSNLSNSKEQFQESVASQNLNLAALLDIASTGAPWVSLPFEVVLDQLQPLRPRHYSISSSSQVSPRTIHITAAIKTEQLVSGHTFRGLTSQYLMSAGDMLATGSSPNTHQLKLTRNKDSDVRIAIGTRKSNFRLPSNPSTPIIMIGPGTGVAPFRAFMAEKKAAWTSGTGIGKCVLFTGCRTHEEDYMYQEEWEACQAAMGDNFELHVAFSRAQSSKVYVQHLVREEGAALLNLIDHQNAHIYICGDVKMAQDVTATLIQSLAQHRSLSKEKARQFITDMKSNRRFQEDVW
ncbi:hypothetical protein SCAR479_08231 [Seiridium cardinale]|uniref:NADPH--cytochrome P450 reductase n=1 Tax=Seiridium cardinale TaxID=138064 RepID=A0ABR2XMB7_9PEZI